MNFVKKYIFILLSGLFPLAALADGTFSVTASIDSAELLMGYTTRLRLQIDQPEKAKVAFPLLKGNAAGGVIPLRGDSVEMSTTYRLDTIRRPGGRILVNYNMTVQAFDSGYYELPEFAFVCGSETRKSNSVALKVLPVKVAADAEISGFTDIAEPEEATKKNDSSDRSWLERYWWIILIAVVVAAAAVWAFRKYRREGTLLPVKPVVPPYDEAMTALDNLKKRNLWQTGKEKAYYTGLTLILRRYLSKEWNIPAMEMTSGQIMKALKANPELKSRRDGLRKLLDMADFAKFAKVRPLPEDNEESFDVTSRFIKDAHRRHLDLIELEIAKKNSGGGGKKK